jgi:hypothetical protein
VPASYGWAHRLIATAINVAKEDSFPGPAKLLMAFNAGGLAIA